MQVFGTLKLLMALWKPSCPLLGCSSPKIGLLNGPGGPKVVKNLVLKQTQKNKNRNVFGPVLGPKMDMMPLGAP